MTCLSLCCPAAYVRLSSWRSLWAPDVEEGVFVGLARHASCPSLYVDMWASSWGWHVMPLVRPYMSTCGRLRGAGTSCLLSVLICRHVGVFVGLARHASCPSLYVDMWASSWGWHVYQCLCLCRRPCFVQYHLTETACAELGGSSDMSLTVCVLVCTRHS
jgi:hypothetical protein